MALFYLIAKKETKLDWIKIHAQISSYKYKYICIFPIPFSLGLPSNGIGITASGKFEKSIKEVKAELMQALDVLWQNECSVFDLYKGEEITVNTYATILNYI